MSRPNYLPLPITLEPPFASPRREYRSFNVRCMGRLVRVTFYATLAYELKVLKGKPFTDDQLDKAGGDLWGWGWDHAGIVGQKVLCLLQQRGIVNNHGRLSLP